MRNNEEEEYRQHIHQRHGGEDAVICNHLIVQAQGPEVGSHNGHLAGENQRIKKQIIGPGAHKGEHPDGGNAGLHQMHNHLKEGGKPVAAVHQGGIFQILRNVIEKIPDNEGGAGQPQGNGDQHHARHRVQELHSHQYIEDADEQKHTGKEAQQKEHLLQNGTAGKLNAAQGVAGHEADDHFRQGNAGGKQHRIGKGGPHGRHGILAKHNGLIKKAEILHGKVSVHEKGLGEEGDIDQENRQAQKHHGSDGNMLLPHFIGGPGFIFMPHRSAPPFPSGH